MNLKEIKEIIALMQENDLTEIEIERDGLKLKLKKGSTEAAPNSSITAASRTSMPGSIAGTFCT